jgi:hypothetical protein
VDPDLIRRVANIIRYYNYNQVEVSKFSKVSNTVLCNWLKGKYKGDNKAMNKKVGFHLLSSNFCSSLISPLFSVPVPGLGRRGREKESFVERFFPFVRSSFSVAFVFTLTFVSVIVLQIFIPN